MALNCRGSDVARCACSLQNSPGSFSRPCSRPTAVQCLRSLLPPACAQAKYLALKWQDINWKRGTVSIARTLERVSGGWRFAETKQARSRRMIKLQGWVLGVLNRLHTKTNSEPECRSWGGGTGLIFKTTMGRPIDSDKLARQHKSILQGAGLPMIRLYDLRHSGATLALAVSHPRSFLSNWGMQARHSFWTFISHVLPHMQAEAAERVEALLYLAPVWS